MGLLQAEEGEVMQLVFGSRDTRRTLVIRRLLPMTSVALALAAFCMIGCSGGAIENSDTIASEASYDNAVRPEPEADGSQDSDLDHDSSELSMLGASEWPTNDVTEGVPEPQLERGPSSVTTGGIMATVVYDGVDESNAAAYVDALKDAGFTFNVTEIRSSGMYQYVAYDSDSATGSTMVSIHYSGDGKLQVDVSNFALM